MDIASLSKEQANAMNRIVLSATVNLVLITLAILLLGTALILGGALVMHLMLSPIAIFFIAIPGQFILFFVVPKLYLKRCISKSKAGFKLKLTEQVQYSFPYVWKWFFIVAGIQVLAMVIQYFIRLNTNSGLGIVVLISAYFIANYYVVIQLLKSDAAALESIN